MEFLAWHYGEGIRFYAKRYGYILRSIVHYFSLPVLLTSLFSPWKRLVIVESGPGFDLAAYLSNLSFNLVSRFIGAIVRIILFITGSALYILFAIFGALGFVFWLIIPLVSIDIYFKYKNKPDFVARDIWLKMKEGRPVEVLLSSNAGKFLVTHIGLSAQKMLSRAKPYKYDGRLSPESFTEIIEHMLEREVWDALFFREENIKKEDLLTAARWWDKRMASLSGSLQDEGFESSGLGRELLFGYTPKLRKVSTDMGARTDFSHRLIGRQEVVSRMERTISGGKSIMLTGEAGVGKKTVVYEFAHRARRGELGRALAYRKILEVDYNFVFAATKDKNRKKQEVAEIFSEASSAGNIILVLRDLHRLTSSESEGMDLTDILETHLEKGKLNIIAIVTQDDYEKYLARNSRLKKFFEKVEVIEPTVEQAAEILLESADSWETKRGITITVPALRRVLEGAEQYITDIPFPEKAIELLDAVVFLEEQRGADNTITTDDVNAALAERTGISFASLSTEETAKLANLEEVIHERLVNQDMAVNLISRVLRSKSIGVVSTKRPIGSFLFLGPTGVGKTETAKVLAKVYFGSEDKVLRFDMAEYVGREGVERLIGSASDNQPGALTTAIKNHQSGLLLLDEIEKAPPAIYNLLLAILEEGELRDAFGKTVSCRNLFIIATSNAGAEYIRQQVSSGVEDLQKEVVDFVLKQNLFSPEFVNRFDGVVVYEPLTSEHLVKVARILLSGLSVNLEEKNITVNFSDEAVKKLSVDGYEPEFGARPMRRIIELSIGDLLGKAILSEEIKPGDNVLVLPGTGVGEFRWEKTSA